MLGQQIRFSTNTLPEESISTETTDYLAIPKLKIKAPIIWAQTDNEESLQAELLNGIVHHPNSSVPNNQGNGVYIGHSSNYWWEKSDYNTIFALLEKLEPDDEIMIYSDNQDLTYTVTSKQTVPKNSSEIFEATENEEQITLVTCWPPGTDWQDLIVKAKLKK